MTTELVQARTQSNSDTMNDSAMLMKARPEKGFIRVFTPAHFNTAAEKQTDEALQGLVRKSLGAKIAPRIYRCISHLGGAVLCALLITFSQVNWHVSKAICILLAGMFIAYFLHIYFLVGYSKTAHRIYSLSGVVPDWTTMPITSRQLVYQYEPIQSISEYSAIGGGVANQMLVVISSCAWMILLVQQLNNIWFEKLWLSFTNGLNCNGCNRHYVNLFTGSSGLDGIFMFIGTFGLLMIGIFELDPYSKILQHGHMTGVYLGFFCPIGFSTQQLYAFINDGANMDALKKHPIGIASSIILDVVAIIFAIIWQFYFNKKSDELAEELKKNIPQTDDEEKEAQKRIRDLTIKNVFSESITLLAGSLCLCLWLWNYTAVYPSYIKKDAYGVLPNGGPWKEFYTFIVEKYDCGKLVNPPVPNPTVNYCSA